MNKFFAAACLLAVFTMPARAEKINLVADDRVEWHQNKQKMVAVGNAVASKQDMSVRADTITAFYENAGTASDRQKSKSQIKTVHAQGGVVMKSARADGFGDTLDYDVAADTMVLRGRPAKIKTETEDITARGSITYYPSKQQAVALDNVIATDAQKNKVYADRMISFFEKNAQGALEMKRVEIYDNVKIVTKDAEVTADRGVYLPKDNLVNLYDRVVIKQDGNFIRGDYAVTDLSTGVSRLLTRKGSGKRVSGVFREKDKDEKKKGGTPAPEQKQTAPDTQSQARPATGAEPEKTWELGTAD